MRAQQFSRAVTSALRVALRLGVVLCLGVVAVSCKPARGPTVDQVDGKTIGIAQQAPQDWLSHGRTYGEHRFSPLTSINAGNVAKLGLAWEASLDSTRIGIQATPIVVDGVLYTTSSYSRVFAFDAKTGKQLWMYDPKPPHDWQVNGCCKAVNRGVALWKGKVYVGVIDGRLVALDAHTGAKVWEVNTTGGLPHYTITGAPLVANGRVIIGNGGADLGTRGFVSAYDAETGKPAWRFYVVPDDPKKGFETPDVALAAKTWAKDHDWSHGGDGNPWNAISYDPDSDLIYIGTGNRDGADQVGQTARDRADNLFTSSIVAIHGATGRLAWHYQTTPGDIWDYDAAQNLVLSDLKIGGQVRKVLMQANKNGFFYVLDRQTGRLISAQKFVRANWASGIDMKTGRPIVSADAEFGNGPKLIFPSLNGAHNWPGMSFSSKTGLVYIPARDSGHIYGAKELTWFYNGYPLSKLTKDPADVIKKTTALLIAWDPVTQKKIWSSPVKTFNNTGVLSTAGGLVAYGAGDGYLRFYADDTGKVLKEIFVGTGLVAPPISYGVDGVQYIAFAAGWAGYNPDVSGPNDPDPYDNSARLIVLKLGGGPVAVAQRIPRPPLLGIDAPQPAEMVTKGRGLYVANCAICHGFVGEQTTLPDLRRISTDTFDGFDAIVLGGAFREGGMPSFASKLKPADTLAIKAYLVDWAQRTKHGQPTAAAHGATGSPGT